MIPGASRLLNWSEHRWTWDSSCGLRSALLSRSDSCDGRGLIHKDLKPANVMIELSSGQVWLMGFGIGSRLPRERHSAAPPNSSPTESYTSEQPAGCARLIVPPVRVTVRAMATFETERFDVGAECLGDPWPVEGEERDQGVITGR